MRIATAIPTPNCFIISVWPAANPRNTTTISKAADITMRPVRWSPSGTARSLSPVSS
jgi:hypothetical protein